MGFSVIGNVMIIVAIIINIVCTIRTAYIWKQIADRKFRIGVLQGFMIGRDRKHADECPEAAKIIDALDAEAWQEFQAKQLCDGSPRGGM